MSGATDGRVYDETPLRRLLDDAEIMEVNGSPVEVRSTGDLAAGHLDPWLVMAEEKRRSEEDAPGLTTVLRDAVGYLVSRDRTLLRARAKGEAAMASDAWARDVTAGAVQVTRTELALAGEDRPVWTFAREPSHDGPRPAFVHLHGGAFSAGTPNGRDPFLKVVADRSDAVAFDLDYSMIPERTFPQAVHEARALLLHLHANAEELGLDPMRITVGGGSAGGNLAAATAIMARDEGDPPVALQALLSPFLSFGGPPPGLKFERVTVVDEHRKLAGWQNDPLSSRLTRMLYRAYRGDGHHDDPLMSPALATDLTGLAPALVVTSEMDPLHQSAEHYAGDLARAGVPVRTIRYRGVLHDSVARVGYLPHAEAAALELVGEIERLPAGG